MNRQADPITRSMETYQKEIAFAAAKIKTFIPHFAENFPGPSSVGGIYPIRPNEDWTSSFWTGMLWLCWEATGDDDFRRAAEAQLPSFYRRAYERLHTDTHDLGFLYTLSCVAAWKLTGNQEARNAALAAADLLMERFLPAAGIIQAWGNLNDPANRGRMIVDCTMNLPLLHWASDETGKPTYRDAAISHMDRTLEHIFRDDHTTFHTFFMNPETGAPLHGTTAQGYADDSCWARGQAWAMYGLPLGYRHTHNPNLLHRAAEASGYFLEHLPADGVCFWDLIFTSDNEKRDSSAAAIAVCGLLEHASHLPPAHPRHRLYEDAAMRMMNALIGGYVNRTREESSGLLTEAVYDMPKNVGVGESCIWGDYFYLEALVRMVRDWRPYW